MIYLYGSNFEVDGVSLNYGDSLRSYGTSIDVYYLTGTITGTLQDGSLMNNTFRIRETDDANIIITPVPSAVILGSLGLTFSGWLLRRRKML